MDWQSFNIAPTQTTNFVQPSASSVTLNRVQAGDPSVIAGHLNANGQVILVNPSGVTFARGAQVNVNSLIATPSDISNSDFMHGRMNFDIPSKDPNARVVNRGRITVAEKGLAALVAPGAANSGVIQAKLGTVVIGGAKTFTVDFYGDGLINFAMTAPVTAVPIGADGKPVTSLVSNSGRIEAAGGTVLMTADAAAGILRNVVDVSGRVGAPTYAQTPGTVTVDAGAGNRARVSGQIDVSGYRPGQVGGTAVVTGGSVDLASTARILARGPAGGGTVMIGGGPHGADAGVRDAQATNVASGAVIDASATANGSGGNVTVWSDGTTTFNGTIFARGGPQGGDGGWVETSGRALSIDANAVVDTGALVPSGKLGTWLLDPTDLDITTTTQNTTESGGNPDTVSVTQPSDSGGAATVSNTAIEDALVNGNVVLTTVGSPASTAGNPTGETATGKITVDAPIAWMSANTLTMTAAGDIVINQPIAGAAGILILNAGGGVGQAAAGTISVAALEVSAVGPVSLGQANAVGTVAGDVTGSGNSFLLSNSAALTVNTVDGVVGITTAGGNIGLITTAGNLTLSNNVAAGTASVALQSAGEILQNG
ncbi:MAG TPA: filamentous hemagglutinin N-terminal domain-containing protein, partial [Acidimicrobiales bacterium]|nr:filamentous hemagglutinin N-terminal domain-containing protein [Acidimicrobiales bacterium]